MSQGAVEKALGKLVTDDAFRARFFADPAIASVTAGLALSRVEVEALAHLSPQALARFSRQLDDRIRRLALDEEQRGSDAAPCARTPGGEGGQALPEPLGAVGGSTNAREHPRDTGPTKTVTRDHHRRTQMKTMKKAVLAVFAVGLMVGAATLAFAQSSQGMGGAVPSYPSDAYRSMDTGQPGWVHPGQDGGGAATMAPTPGSQGMGGAVPSYPSDAYRPMNTMQPGWVHTGAQIELTVTGKIAAVDFAHQTLTLTDGESFTLPANLEYATLPAIGQQVEVTFAEQNGQRVVRWIDLDDTADSHSNS
jgi:Protein of unknown function (DUF1344)